MPASTHIMFPLSDPVRWLFVIVLCDSSRDHRVHSVWTLSNLCDGLEICFSACLCCFTPCLSSVFCPLFLCRSLIMANFVVYTLCFCTNSVICGHSTCLCCICPLFFSRRWFCFTPNLPLPHCGLFVFFFPFYFTRLTYELLLRALCRCIL